MDKRKQYKLKSVESKNEIQDCVFFMTAYNLNQYNRKLPNIWKNEGCGNLLSKYHISTIASEDTIRTRKGKLKYTTHFDPHKQSTQFKFDLYEKGDSLENYQDEINQISWILSLSHSREILLDKSMFDFSLFLKMESFLVSINSRLLQVDPIVFFLNSIVIVNFELIDYSTGIPLKRDEIYGRNNNYNIIPTEGIQYIDMEMIITETRKIPDIIFDNVIGFIEKVGRNRFQITSISYIHNLFVISNSISNIKTYFLDVLGAEGLDIVLNNLNTSNNFKYYSQEYLGVSTSIDFESKQQALFDCMLLEVLKIYFFLNQIVNYNVTDKLNETISKQMQIEYLSFVSGTPILTINAIDNMKQTETFKRNKSAIEFKISYLNLEEERRKNKNAFLLNILLYILAFLGGISTLQVLQTEYGWSFKVCSIILSFVFLGFGMLWIYQERKK
ncbi:hypothetical protein ACTQ6A_15990 [Lachnospiraceae bacterium LCP25S3_G4]